MAVLIKNLAKGIASGSASPTGTKSWLIKNIVLTNAGGGNATSVNVRVNVGGTLYHVAPKDMTMPIGNSFVIDDEITLQGTEAIDIAFTGTVHWVVNGVERE